MKKKNENIKVEWIDRQIKFCRKKIPFIYLMMVLIMVFATILNYTFGSRSTTFCGLKDYREITASWTDRNGKAFDFTDLNQYASDDGCISVYYQLPDDVEAEETIVFWSKNACVEVYIDGKQIFKTDIEDAPFFNHSPGNRWNIFSVTSKDSGKTIEMKIKLAYHDGFCKVDHFYMGDHTAIFLDIIKQKIFALSLCAVLLFVGLLYLFVAIVINVNQIVKDYSLFYLAVFAICSACWCMIETNILQLFLNNVRQIQVISDMMLTLGTIPVFLYLDCIYAIFKIWFIRILFVINMLYIFLCIISQLAGAWDFHQTLAGTVIAYGITFIILITYIIRQEHEYRKIQRRTVYDRMQEFGVAVLGFAVIGEWIRFWLWNVMDRAFIMSIGLSVSIVCFGAGNIFRLSQLVKQGMETEVIGNLAYMDGLTQVGNRTAYIEKLDVVVHDMFHQKLTIILFDINNLKETNDVLGHHAGDDLIKISAEIICKTFGRYGEVYRIGGDEFTVISQNEKMAGHMNELAGEFHNEIDRCNQTGEYSFQVGVAFGWAACNEISKRNIRMAERLADERMYKNKQEMKKTNG